MTGPIIIADDLVTDRIALKARLSAAYARVVQVRDPADLAQEVGRERPDAIVMDIHFPGGGIQACRRLKSDPRFADIPVLLYGASGDRHARMAAFEAGADECLADLPGERLLLALLRNLKRKSAEMTELARRNEMVESHDLAEAQMGFTPAVQVCVIAPDRANGVMWRSGLQPVVAGEVTLVNAARVLEDTQNGDAFVIGFDPEQPNVSLRLISELRVRAGSRHGVIVLQLPGDLDDQADIALDLGADAVVPGPFAANELGGRLSRLLARKQETDRLRAMVDDHLDVALRDPLTGLYNRRYAQGYLKRLSREAAEKGSAQFALLMLDIDYFKAVNDRHGHLVGDEVLCGVAKRLTENLRDIDLAARIGGEEFLVVLQDTDETRAGQVAERLRRAIGARPITARDAGVLVPVTMSIGVAVAENLDDTDARLLMQKADDALYASKAAGRNAVTFAALGAA